MALHVWVEPTFALTPWYEDFSLGIKTAASVNHIKPIISVLESPTEIHEDSMVFLLGETTRWFTRMTETCLKQDVPSCTVTCSNVFSTNASSITNAHGRDMSNLLHYMKLYGRGSTALFGFNPSSPVDHQRLMGNRTVSEQHVCDDDIYYVFNCVENLADQLIRHIDRYNSVICGNDVYAIYLINRLRERGIRVPEDMFVASFGNIMLSSAVSPSVSSMPVDLKQMAHVAVSAYAGWTQKSWGANFSFTVESVFHSRASTSFLEMPHTLRQNDMNIVNQTSANFPDNKSSYTDEPLFFISALNNFLQRADQTDMGIMKALMNGTPLETLAEQLYLSKRGIDYRLSKIYRRFNISSRRELSELMKKYNNIIHPEELSNPERLYE